MVQSAERVRVSVWGEHRGRGTPLGNTSARSRWAEPGEGNMLL